MRELQDAKISVERLAEIHGKEDEEINESGSIDELREKFDLDIKNISFRYIGSDNFVLRELNLYIPSNKITAIVGTSGSGKTTLMKLLLKFYEPNQGEILLGNYNLKNVSQKSWRNKCGVVMQEDYIFNDTIANNIAVGVDYIDKEKLKYAIHVANIKSFIEEDTIPGSV